MIAVRLELIGAGFSAFGDFLEFFGVGLDI
jgi:hypothetical protein